MVDQIHYDSSMSVSNELQTETTTGAIVDSAIAGLEVAAYIVISRQIDNTLDPSATPTTGDKYIIENSASLHANFGTITGIGDDDIVKYDGTAFVIDYNSSARGSGSLCYVRAEDAFYYDNGTRWVEYTVDNPALKNVITIQTDATTDPSASPTAHDRYIITDSSALHANFGSPTVSDDDILEYDGSVFNVVWDASVKGEGYFAWVEDANERYTFDGASWVENDSITDHDDMQNIGVKTHATLDSEVDANTTHASSDGTDHSNVVLNDTHRASDGSDHTFIDQSLISGASPTLDGTNFTGVDFTAIASTDFGDAMELIHGNLIDSPSLSVTSDGTTITLSIEKDGGGDLRVMFNQAVYVWDTSPADTVTLTAGSDTSPTLNYIYFDSATKTLIANTTGFPLVELSLVAKVSCQSASSLQTDGAYSVHLLNDHLFATCGHITHINQWIRSQNATYADGVAQTLTITTNGGALDDVIFTSASGNVLQLHHHAFPAFSGTPDLYVVNDSATAYDKITNMNTLLTDSTGASMSAKRFSLVIFGVVSEDSGDCKLYVNLPSGYYNSNSGVIADSSKFANYTIPAQFKGTGFLIYEMKLRHQTSGSGTWTSVENVDLRGLQPSLSAGSGTTGSSDFVDNAFKIESVADSTAHIDFSASNITTATTRTITMADFDVDLANLDQDVTSGANPSFATPIVSTKLDLTGGQIAFPATQNASADANTLDDYEEGTFDVYLHDYSYSSSESQTYFLNSGTYEKTGRKVSAKIRIGMTSLGTLTTTDAAFLGGLPFTPESSSIHGIVAVGFGNALSLTAGTSVSGYVESGATRVVLKKWSATTGSTNLLISEITSGGDMMLLIEYFV